MILGVQVTHLKILLKKPLGISPQDLFHVTGSFAGFFVLEKVANRITCLIHKIKQLLYYPIAFYP